jgi:hypothetical protein
MFSTQPVTWFAASDGTSSIMLSDEIAVSVCISTQTK